MKFDTVKTIDDFPLRHALSLLLANKSNLLRIVWSNPPHLNSDCSREKMLLSIANFLLGRQRKINFHCVFSELKPEDLECMIMALEVLLVAKTAENGSQNIEMKSMRSSNYLHIYPF